MAEKAISSNEMAAMALHGRRGSGVIWRNQSVNKYGEKEIARR